MTLINFSLNLTGDFSASELNIILFALKLNTICNAHKDVRIQYWQIHITMYVWNIYGCNTFVEVRLSQNLLNLLS